MFVETRKEGEAPVLTEFSYRSFLAWLEQQPPEGAYDFGDAERCAAGRFYRSHGKPVQVFVSGVESVASDLGFGTGDAKHYKMLDALGNRPQTFGAALQRLRNYCGE
jgi:hypothetical protein